MAYNNYSVALFDITNEKANTNSIKTQFQDFYDVLKKQSDFRKLLNHPAIKLEDKKAIIKNVFKNIDLDLLYFLYVVLDNNRFDMIDEIYHDFESLIFEQNDTVLLEVYSVNLLSEAQKQRITNLMTKRFVNKKIIIENLIDKNLIGGIKVLHAGVSIDISLKVRLEELKAVL